MKPSEAKDQESAAAAKEDQPTGLALLRVPFPPHQISLLPKPKQRDAPKGNCKECGGYHGLPAIHLSYVGHAALTARLLDADPAWNWEPLALDDKGLPLLDAPNAGLWIKLTVCGVTRLGYGDAQGKTGGDAMKERIGDALRNAAMRFGAALDLWHKGDLYINGDEDEDAAARIHAAKVTPMQDYVDIFNSYDAITKDFIINHAMEIISIVEKKGDILAYVDSQVFDTETEGVIWSQLPSKVRSAIKQARQVAALMKGKEKESA